MGAVVADIIGDIGAQRRMADGSNHPPT